MNPLRFSIVRQKSVLATFSVWFLLFPLCLTGQSHVNYGTIRAIVDTNTSLTT